VLALAARVAFWGAPLTTDEGGYAEIARLWDRGVPLYGDAWVDRPQGLLLVYRALLVLGGGSTESLRILAAGVAVLVVIATALVALRLCGTIEAIASALLLGTFAASPFLESFTLSGELLASLPAVLSLLAFTAYLRVGQVIWLAAAGLLTGCAVMIKQSAFDAGLAAFLFLLLAGRKRGREASILVLAALVPVAIAWAAAPHAHDWWNAVVAYRAEGDSLLTGSRLHRLQLFADSLPAAAKGLGVLTMLAALGWRSAPLLARLWLGAALVGVLGGGNFHPHYYLQLAAPLSILAAVGIRQLLVERRPLATAACAGAALATLAVTAPLWFATGPAQARAIWPKDRHLAHSERIASYVRARTRPDDRIYVVWAGADLYYLADRRPALRYLWYRNVERIDGALASARRMLAARRPALVVVAQRPGTIDPSGATAEILRRKYRLAARVEGVPILEPARRRR
jgi:4-amino-4-deoxy-L-arabinose transferase-like glycosyltransferase